MDADSQRIDTFVDAAFAFAVTLLVISFDAVPANWDELGAALRAVPSFAASFATLMLFWNGHRRWSRVVEDRSHGALVALSLLLVFLVLVFVYPLRVMFEGLVQWLSGGAIASSFTVASSAGARALFVTYGIGFACLGGVLAALHAAALRQGGDRHALHLGLGEWLAYTATGLVSAAVALLLPDAWLSLAGFVYATLGLSIPAWHTVAERRRRA